MLFHLFIVLFYTFLASTAVATIEARATTPPPPRSLVPVHQQRQQQRQEQEAHGYTDYANGKHVPEVAGDPDCSEFVGYGYLNHNYDNIPLPCRQKDDNDNEDKDGNQENQEDSDATSNNTPPLFAPPVEDEDGTVGDIDTPPAQGGSGPESLPDREDNNEETDNGNRIRVKLYVGIRPYIPNIEPIVTAAVTKWLNSTIENMDFFLNDPFRQRNLLRQRFRRIQDDELLGVEGGNGGSGSGGGELDSLLGIEGGDGIGSGGDLLNNPSSVYQEEPLSHSLFFKLIHFDTESELVVKTNRRWYWKHTVSYNCLFRDDNSPVLDRILLRYVTENVTYALEEDVESSKDDDGSNSPPRDEDGLITTLRRRTGDEGVTITIKPEELPSTSGADDASDPNGTSARSQDGNEESTTGPSISSIPRGGGGDVTIMSDGSDGGGNDHHVTYPTPLNSQEWDWRRYLGLTMFLGTIVGTLVLSQIHAHRQRRLIKSQVWGNLASEEGVNELLKTGWKVQGTSSNKKVLEIYDKSKWGYRENDSMLIGGFEQREAVVGAEITLTHAPSETNTQANISITQESHHTPPQPPPPGTTTPTGSVTTPVQQQQDHQYGSPPTTPPHGGGGGGGGAGRRGPSTTTKNNNGSPPSSRSRF